MVVGITLKIMETLSLKQSLQKLKVVRAMEA